MKKCRICDTELTKENWMPSLMKKNCVICRECSNEKGRQWRSKNRKKFNKYSMDRYFSNPKQNHAITNKCRKKLRIDTIIEYGGRCNHCGIDDFEVLDIDHINNDGAFDRKKNIFAYNLYRKLKKERFPKDRHQLLCKNCNWKKEIARRRDNQIFKAIEQYERT